MNQLRPVLAIQPGQPASDGAVQRPHTEPHTLDLRLPVGSSVLP